MLSALKDPTTTSKLLCGVLGLAAAAAFFGPAVAGSDLWWHLASGRLLVESGAIPSSDSFSYTFSGHEWMNHEWLWDVLFWGFHSISPQAVAWVNLALLLVAYGLAWQAAARESESPLGASLAIVAAAATAFWFLDIRPQVTTLVFIGLFLATRHDRWAPYLWPPLVALWANLHGGFVFGVGMIGLHVVALTIERSVAAGRLDLPRREWISVGLCLLAMLANPWSYRILEFPLAYLDSASPYRDLNEWRAPGWHWSLRYFEGRFTWLCLATLPGWLLMLRRDRYLPALVAVTFLMAVTSRRFIPIFGLTAAPLIALAVAQLLTRLERRIPRRRRRTTARALALVGLLLTGFLWRDVRLLPDLLGRWTQRDLFPDAALEFLDAVGHPRRLFNHYNWGGWIVLHRPGRMQLYIDGRANTVYDDEIYRDYETIVHARPGFRERLAKRPPEMVFLPSRLPLVKALQAPELGWRPIYFDSIATILVPPDSPYLQAPIPSPFEVLGEHRQVLMVKSRAAEMQGDRTAARTILETLLAAHPLHVAGWNQLLLTYRKDPDAAGLERVRERAFAASPRRYSELGRTLARVHEGHGRLAEALEAATAAIPTSPFIADRTGALQNVARLRAKLK